MSEVSTHKLIYKLVPASGKGKKKCNEILFLKRRGLFFIFKYKSVLYLIAIDSFNNIGTDTAIVL